MKLPGFTAESSLGKPSRAYWSQPRATRTFGRQMPSVMPAQAEETYADADEFEESEAESFDPEAADIYDENGDLEDADATGDIDATDENDVVVFDAGEGGDDESGDEADGEVGDEPVAA